MEFWQTLLITLAPTILTAVLGFVTGQMSKQAKANDDIKLGLKELLRDKIMSYYEKYVPAGKIPASAYQNVEEMYQTYHNLGGNGFITKEYEELKKLIIERGI